MRARTLVAISALLVVVIAATATWLALRPETATDRSRGPTPRASVPSPAPSLRPGTITRIRLGSPPADIEVGEGAAWTTNGCVSCGGFESLLWRVDAKTFEAKPVEGTAGALHVAVGAGAVWVSTCPDLDGGGRCRGGGVVRVDPASGVVTSRVPLYPFPGGLAAGPDSVWIVSDDSLIGIDARTARVSSRFRGLCCSVWGQNADGVWLVGQSLRSALRVDPATGRVTGRVPAPPRGGIGLLVVGEHDVWAMAWERDVWALWRIDSSTAEVELTLPTARFARLGLGSGAVWLASGQQGPPLSGMQVRQVRSDRFVGRPLRLRFEPEGHRWESGPFDVAEVSVAVDEDALWLSVYTDGEVIRIQLPIP